jgi:NADH-quinone oxidoreductase subunit C
MNTDALITYIEKYYADQICLLPQGISPPTFVCQQNDYIEVCKAFKDDQKLSFDTLIDLCGIDYLHYGLDEWASSSATADGFSRGVNRIDDLSGGIEETDAVLKPTARYAINLQFLSVEHNHRIALKVFLDDSIMIDSVKDIWASADWYEREAFDLYGIIFKGHEDLRRLLTDYGFIGHPFRKDFPVSGYSEVRYDADQGRVVYEPVSIEERTLIPKSRIEDHRYESGDSGDSDA